MPVIEKIISAFTGFRREVVGDYRQLVKQVADDVDVPTDEAIAVLSSAGKTANDLQKDADTLVLRREAAAVMKDAADAHAELARLDRAEFDLAAKRTAEIEAADNKYRPLFKAIEGAKFAANSRTSQELNARQLLIDTADASINLAIKPLIASRADLAQKITNVDEQLRESDRAIGDCHRKIRETTNSKELKTRYENELAGFEGNKRKRLEQRSELQSAIGEINRQINELESRKLAP